jgi:hypothetical protein
MLLVSPFDVLERAEKIRREIHSLALRISVHLITKNPFFFGFFFWIFLMFFFWFSNVLTVLDFPMFFHRDNMYTLYILQYAHFHYHYVHFVHIYYITFCTMFCTYVHWWHEAEGGNRCRGVGMTGRGVF